MKSLLVKLGVILIFGLAIFGYLEVWGANWKLYAFNAEETFFYDAASVISPSKSAERGMVKVWIREDFTNKGVKKAVKELGKKYEKISSRKSLMEINCKDKMYRNLSSISYAYGEEIISSSNSQENWQPIIPKSVGEELYKAVCR